MRTLLRVGAWTVGGLALLAAVVVAVIAYQGRQPVKGRPQYVALGSSFAAGIGLGPTVPGSPFVCQRSADGYPGRLAGSRGLSLVDVSCSGATTANVLKGGQAFQRPQIDALDPRTELVTLTSGGNDVRYVGDLALMAGSASKSFTGWLLRTLWSGPLAPEARPYAQTRRDLVATLAEIRRRAPRARIVLVTYPRILPEAGTCDALQLTSDQVAAMRTVGDRLAQETRTAAAEAGVELVDMHALASGHDACSAEPWVNGWGEARKTPFHPTAAGAAATAQAIGRLLDGAGA